MKKISMYKIFLAVSDFYIVFFSCLVSHLLFLIYQGNPQPGSQHHFSFLVYAVVCSVLIVMIFQYHDLYKINVAMAGTMQVLRLLKAEFFGVISMITLSFIFKFRFGYESRVFILLFAFFGFSLFIIGRVVVFRFLYSFFAKNKIIRKPVLIIGAGKAGLMLAAKLMMEQELGIEVIGFLDDNKSGDQKTMYNLKVLGKIDEIGKIIAEHKIDEVIIAIDNIDYSRLLALIDLCASHGLIVKTSSELFSIINQKFNIEKYSGIPIVEASPIANNTFFMFYKRLFDIILTLFGIILLLPVFIPIVILIRLTSKGPVLYTQTRIGKDGVPFRFYKFRSMTVLHEDDEERKKMMIDFMKNGKRQEVANSKIVNTSRVTGIGSFLRKTSLDELPQLLNVLKGDMSLVGPRPCLPYEYENYDEWQKRRVSVIPGCTGLWQVSGRSEVSFVDSVILDLYYINKMSPWLDLQIIFRTVPVMLFARGGK